MKLKILEHDEGEITKAQIRDANGYTWLFDLEEYRSLRIPEADGPDCPDNGFCIDSFPEAILWLQEGGYIDEA